ncbi:uncharacterized protein RAG0_11369 [Rhynchosporium agropyri]|uniref:Uncharacterized protein n=1 Tax=Rhynchosporium agropyri TaxID=914238 RepID=A0A1E1L691_9HELO|nr:uncharacterized protein RAG0_11369 [Rhynchosporium agropyri]
MIVQDSNFSPQQDPIDPIQGNYDFNFSLNLLHLQDDEGVENQMIADHYGPHNNNIVVDPLYQDNFLYNGDISHFEGMQQLSPLQYFRLPHLIIGVDTLLQKQLFDQYRFSTSTFLTTSSTPENLFNSIVLPLAVQDKTLMRLLLSLAGSQSLKRVPPGSNPELQRETVRLHQEAQQEQYRRVQIMKAHLLDYPSDSNHDGASILAQIPRYTDRYLEIIFATYLTLCLYEVFEGTGDGAGSAHLASAGYMIDLASKLPQDSERSLSLFGGQRTKIHPCLLDFYNYHGSLAGVTSPSISIIQLEYDEAPDTFGHDPPLVGVQDGLIKFIPRISALRNDADKIHGEFDYSTINTGLEIFADLDAWRPQPTSTPTETLAAGFYQKALFIWLFSIIYPKQSGHERVQDNVKCILKGMCEIQPGDGVMACMLFPLFVAGSAALEKEDRKQVIEHFAALKLWSAFGNIDSTCNTVKEMWKLRDAGDENSWDWVRLLRSTQMSILVT